MRQKIYMECINSTIHVSYRKRWANDEVLGFTDVERFATIVLNINEPLKITTIVHEVIHAARFELEEKRGFEYLDCWDDELLPHVCDYIVGQILKFCKKKGYKYEI